MMTQSELKEILHYKLKHLGLYTDIEEAKEAYLRAKKELHPFSNTYGVICDE